MLPSIIRLARLCRIPALTLLLAACAAPFEPSEHNYSSTYDGGRSGVFPEQIAPPGRKVFVFDPQKMAWGAYNADGQLVGHDRASGGASWCYPLNRPCATPAGTYNVYSIGSFNCESGKYPEPTGGAPMPYCMFFYKGFSIHGAPLESVPDYNDSHGCVRVTVPAAQWLHDNFIQIGTKVEILPYPNQQ